MAPSSAGMLAPERTPPSVACIVGGFWSFISEARSHRVLPDGAIDCSFDLTTGTATVVGPMHAAQTVELPLGGRIFRVRFVPGPASADALSRRRAIVIASSC